DRNLRRRRGVPRSGPPLDTGGEGRRRRAARQRDERRTHAARPQLPRAAGGPALDRHRLDQMGGRYRSLNWKILATGYRRLLANFPATPRRSHHAAGSSVAGQFHHVDWSAREVMESRSTRLPDKSRVTVAVV